jgi:hypothetical protein
MTADMNKAVRDFERTKMCLNPSVSLFENQNSLKNNKWKLRNTLDCNVRRRTNKTARQNLPDFRLQSQHPSVCTYAFFLPSHLKHHSTKRTACVTSLLAQVPSCC